MAPWKYVYDCHEHVMKDDKTIEDIIHIVWHGGVSKIHIKHQGKKVKQFKISNGATEVCVYGWN